MFFFKHTQFFVFVTSISLCLSLADHQREAKFYDLSAWSEDEKEELRNTAFDIEELGSEIKWPESAPMPSFQSQTQNTDTNRILQQNKNKRRQRNFARNKRARNNIRNKNEMLARSNGQEKTGKKNGKKICKSSKSKKSKGKKSKSKKSKSKKGKSIKGKSIKGKSIKGKSIKGKSYKTKGKKSKGKKSKGKKSYSDYYYYHNNYDYYYNHHADNHYDYYYYHHNTNNQSPTNNVQVVYYDRANQLRGNRNFFAKEKMFAYDVKANDRSGHDAYYYHYNQNGGNKQNNGNNMNGGHEGYYYYYNGNDHHNEYAYHGHDEYYYNHYHHDYEYCDEYYYYDEYQYVYKDYWDGSTFCPNPNSQNLPCAPPNLPRKCDKYNHGNFKSCYYACKPSFCCIHDSKSEFNAPSCSGDANCAQYYGCYIVWWKLHDTIGPATYIRVQQDDDFFNMGNETLAMDLEQIDVNFSYELFGHHFDDDTTLFESKVFEKQVNWVANREKTNTST